MPKLEIERWNLDNAPESRVRVRFWPRTLSMRILRFMLKQVGYSATGTYHFDWDFKLKGKDRDA